MRRLSVFTAWNRDLLGWAETYSSWDKDSYGTISWRSRNRAMSTGHHKKCTGEMIGHSCQICQQQGSSSSYHSPEMCVLMCILFSSALLRDYKKGVHLIHSHVPVSSPKCGPKEVFLVFLFNEFMDLHLMLCHFSDQLTPCACFYQAYSQLVPLVPLLFQFFLP